jgi:c(7)-type cytochrome triheme protein
MKKNYFRTIALTLFAGSFLYVSNTSASEEYDVKAFGPETPIVWEKPTRVVFEHRSHTDEIGLECSACHDEIFAMQRGVASRTGKLTMASLAEGQFCGACHDGETAFASDTNCAACHLPPEGTITWEEPTKVTFGHSGHADDLGLECSECHNEIFAMQSGIATNSGAFTMAAFAEGKYCGACHDGETAFASDSDCTTCHVAPQGTITWEEPTKVTFGHSAHADDLGLECGECHTETFAMKNGAATDSGAFTMAAFAEGKYCGACHNGDAAFASDTDCAVCHILPEKDPMVWTKPVKAVVFHHKVHTEEYGLECDSCHNEAFAMKAGAAESSSDFTMKALYDGKYCGKCHDGETAFASNTLCNTCHIGVKGYNRMMGIDAHGASPKDGNGGH